LNMNQKSFRSATATSLSLVIGQDFDLGEELSIVLGCIESRYLQLRHGEYGILMDLYLDGMYRRHEKHTFAADGVTFEGVIADVDSWGKLRIRTDDGVRSFGVKEIRYSD